MKRFCIRSIPAVLFLVLSLRGFAQVVTEPIRFNTAQFDRTWKMEKDKAAINFLQKAVQSDTIPLPFFDDFSGSDVSWALARFYFGAPIRKVWFWGNSVGRAFGNQGLSIRTPNRGKDWNQQTAITPGNLNDVQFLGTSGNGWSCGTNGWLAETSDSGQTWLPVSKPAKAVDALTDIQFVDEQKGILVDSTGSIFYTSNNGTTWDTTTTKGFRARSIYWDNPAKAFAAGDGGTIGRSEDGGQTWTLFSDSGNVSFNKIIFITPNVGIAAGDSGLMYRTQDGGNYWYRVNTKTYGDVLDIAFAKNQNNKIGWATGRSGLLLGTTDGGYNWAPIRSGTGDDLLSIHMITPYRGWIGTSNGRLLQMFLDPTKPDAAKWERNSGTFINNTLCVDPISYGVATFDGLNARGLPYSLTNNAIGACDSLISTNLDLSGPNPTLYVSFYYQPGGRVKEIVPDASDSIVLQFKGPKLPWVSVWRAFGNQDQITTPFKYHSVQIDDTLKHAGFQFRFINYGNQNASYDLWHVDYVRVDETHGPADSSELDVAITQAPGKLMKDFYAYPLDQFNGIITQPGYFADSVAGQVRNLNPESSGITPQSGTFLIKDEAKEKTVFSTTANILGLTDPLDNKNALTQISQNRNFYFSSLSPLSEWTTLRYGFSLDKGVGFNKNQSNDTVYSGLNLSTYMAYDDGSAELVRGVDGNLARGAVKFFLPRTDTLTDISLYFPRVPTTQTQTISFLLMAWSKIDTADNTETELFRSSFILPPPGDTMNKFDHFSLRTIPINKRILEGNKPFYIGWQQRVIDNGNQVRIGCDINSSNPGTFYYNSDATWQLWKFDDFPLMIRPVFGIETPTAVKPSLTAPRSPFYPNPSQNQIRNPEAFSNLEIYNTLGQKLESIPFGAARQTISIDLQTGLYILKWQQTDGQWVSQRLMVE